MLLFLNKYRKKIKAQTVEHAAGCCECAEPAWLAL